ncbi:MAG: CRISPR-associated helicase Cas3' [bacterium]|nr:CRISPR-associated helicase Cas3' [bacterium]
MEDKVYLAHVKEQQQQSVAEHVYGVASLCKLFASEFSDGEYARCVGLFHDLGKYSQEFQKRLLGGPKVDHSLAGALEFANNNKLEGAMCIAGHHGGLPDLGARGVVQGPSLLARIGRFRQDQACIPSVDSVWRKELNAEISSLSDNIDKKSCADYTLSRSFWCHWLYSCLVDADYLDTEAFMDGHIYAPNVGNFDDLVSKLNAYISPWFPPKGPLNEKRCAVLRECIDRGETAERGLYTLTVPTGGGKTIASLAFALHHARARGLKRVIYVIPYTSIIEQNAAVFRKILGDDVILEHHSNYSYENDKRIPVDYDDEARADNMRFVKATENWNMPVVITTAVQFFESLFANKPSKCRKVHNIANSVIIFDEAQMLPLPFLKPCVFAIAELVSHYNATAVLCTATQPALNKLFQDYLPGRVIEEICSAELFADKVFKRVKYRRQGKTNWNDLAEQLVAHDQVLCIVNSRKNAHELFETLREQSAVDGNFHLSTLMCPQHRQQILQFVRQRLSAGQTCRVVSTSLIEAGVDVDFPAVYREFAGLDSILQAAGRCNRENKRSSGESVVTLFEAETPLPSLFAQPAAAARSALHYLSSLQDIDSQETIKAYFTELLDIKGDNALDASGILDLLKKLSHAQAASVFHIIESQNTVFIPYDEKGRELTERWLRGERSRCLLRKLSRYGVSVYDNHYQMLSEAGVLQEGSCDAASEAHENCAVLCDMQMYSELSGLDLQADSGQALFI